MSLKKNTKTRGDRAESIARKFLEQRGLITLASNYHCPCGEIDAVMEDGSTLVFVEVRYRNSSRFGTPADTIDRRKQRRLLNAARHYLQSRAKTTEPYCRFDVVLLSGDALKPDIEWISDAFQA